MSDAKYNQDASENVSAADGELARALASLPRDIEPRRDLWAGIAPRVEANRGRAVLLRRAATGASVLLAAASVALAVRVSPGPVATTEIAPAPGSVEAPETKAERETWDADPVVPEEATYRTALATLKPAFDARVSELPAKTGDAVGASVAAIEAAIGATRASLEETPDDADLRAELDGEYEQEIQTMNDVLDWTTRS